MRSKLIPLLVLCALAACDTATGIGATSGPGAVRIVNAFTSPVDVIVDGSVVIPAMAAASIATAVTPPGDHTLLLRPTGTSTAISQSITASTGATSTIAATRNASTGALSSTVLDDTGSVVPAGATKLRVIHLAPNAGTLQVYRTQPDFPTPVQWQFPFNYQPNPDDLSAPFIQSTVGTWEVRIWQTPADPSGWSSATVKVVVPLASGEKRTILILDAPGGGVTTQIL
ncbi:MAG TPA: DUF4397 domain-containing protein [Gemmatimonadaceae bacterium]|nr:DUF4397 domain-containing protein [Gemmatimonadaceae bacterium]